MSHFEKHRPVLMKAIDALHKRTFYAAFPEHPAPSIYGETADADGQAWFKSIGGKKFEELNQVASSEWIVQEESTNLMQPL